MMMADVIIERLTAHAFRPYGEVIEIAGPPSVTINRGKCGRHHDLAAIDIVDGTAGISLFDGTPYSLPLTLDLVERHPLGSQAFLPMSDTPFLVIVADDDDGLPVHPRAWLTNGQQGVNYNRGTWHGVLTPLATPARFTVIDRIGEGSNLEEAVLFPAFRIVDANGLVGESSA